MNIPSTRWLMPAALLLWATQSQALASQVPPAAPASGPTTTSLSYRSAIQSYKPWAETPVASWRAINDATAQAGGWRAYAREAQQPDDSAKNAPSTQTPARPDPRGRQEGRP